MVEANSEETIGRDFNITLKVSAKGEVYGEYTVRAKDFKELEARVAQVSNLLTKLMQR